MLAASSAALVLVHLAPGDAFSVLDIDPGVAAVERQRLGLDRPFLVQYSTWLARLAVLDLGESLRFRRPVLTLLTERAGHTVLLGCAALMLALAIGIPSGIRTASAPRHWTSRAIRAASLLAVSIPPLVTSLLVLIVAARSDLLPSGGFSAPVDATSWHALIAMVRLLPLPAIALALPIAATVERLQSSTMLEALQHPSVVAARARGISARRVVWLHAWRLALRPVIAVFGIIAGSVLSGSFIVEIVLSWPGLGDLMYEALVSRDLYLAAGCAAAGAVFLAAALTMADVALFAADPRGGELT